MFSVTSGSRNFLAAFGSKCNVTVAAAMRGSRAFGSNHKRKCSKSFSPNVGLNQFESNSKSFSKPTSNGNVRFSGLQESQELVVKTIAKALWLRLC